MTLLAVACGAPGKGTNTVAVPTDYAAGYLDVYVYECVDGYSTGSVVNRISICKTDGTWSLAATCYCKLLMLSSVAYCRSL